MNKFKLITFLAIAASCNVYASSQSTQTESNNYNSHSTTNFKVIPGAENFGCMADVIANKEYTGKASSNSTPDSPYSQLRKQTSQLVANLVNLNENIIELNSNSINELNKARNDQNYSPNLEVLKNYESDCKVEIGQQTTIFAMIQQNQQILMNQKQLQEK